MSASAAARCHRCGAELAAGDEAIDVDGAGQHRLANRGGLVFDVRCFGHAPGCAAGGPATDEDTWFAGHTWQRAFCRRCGVHAGWLFRGVTRVFFALVAAPAPARGSGGRR
ncbi:MAG TPA: cereblon family protein [Kofleriaceae bacterium]|nr:cereblon family protein [Kofleriaceae bacterium]